MTCPFLQGPGDCWESKFPWDLSKEEMERKATEVLAVLYGVSMVSARRILFAALRMVEGVELKLVKPMEG